jgi:hypothetical protein
MNMKAVYEMGVSLRYPGTEQYISTADKTTMHLLEHENIVYVRYSKRIDSIVVTTLFGTTNEKLVGFVCCNDKTSPLATAINEILANTDRCIKLVIDHCKAIYSKRTGLPNKSIRLVVADAKEMLTC